MSTTITSLQDDNISHALFIDLQIGANVYYFSNGYKTVTIDSNDYTELGSFLSIDDFTDDIRSTEGDVSLSLSGIPSDNDYITEITNANFKGGNVTIRRGFYNIANGQIQTDQVFTRYQGVITNYKVTDNANRLSNEQTSTITVICSNLDTMLKNKISGQRTNPEERKRILGLNDRIFDRVPDLYNTTFDFGAEYTANSGGGGRGGGRGGGGGGNNGRNVQQN